MVSIRRISEGDIEGFHKALSSVVDEKKFLLTLSPPSIEKVSDFIRKNIARNAAQYVAVEKDDIVGWADIVPRELEALKHVGLLGMGVISSHRGMGVGSDLMRNVLEHSWEIGLKRIELEVFSSNTTALTLYKKHGFEHEGTKRNGRYLNGKYEDVHFMAQCKL